MKGPMPRLLAAVIALTLAVVVASCGTESRSPSPTSPTSVASAPKPFASIPMMGIQSLRPTSIAFPPQNEPLDFLNQLEVKYRDQLRRPASATFVDPAGHAVWMADYLRYRVNACSHPDAVSKVMTRVDTQGRVDPPECGSAPSGQIPFPPQNEPLDFLNQLESKYRFTLARPAGSTFVDPAGQAVWMADYLRYRLNSCSHGDAVSKVFTRVDSQGTIDPPVCTIDSGPINPVPTNPPLTGSFTVQGTCVAPPSGAVSCSFVASASGGNGSYTYAWVFAGPSSTATPNGQTVSPDLGCGLSTGLVTFNVDVTLRIMSPGSTTITLPPRGVQIARQAGACGT
jgi:hypothetical protein